MMQVSVEQSSRSKIHPWKFALWLGCGSILMMFAGWTSAFVVRHAAGNWLEYRLPNIFFYNTAVILLSSLTLQLSYSFFKKGIESLYKILLMITFLLGLAFVVLQYLGWLEMKAIGVELTKNPSGDFVYVITGFHAAHVLGGIAVLTVAMVHAFALPFRPTPKRQLRFELSLTYWHFVDLLWIYLLIFFITQI
jgi:cytochrome c oxidase subunit III